MSGIPRGPMTVGGARVNSNGSPNLHAGPYARSSSLPSTSSTPRQPIATAPTTSSTHASHYTTSTPSSARHSVHIHHRPHQNQQTQQSSVPPPRTQSQRHIQSLSPQRHNTETQQHASAAAHVDNHRHRSQHRSSRSRRYKHHENKGIDRDRDSKDTYQPQDRSPSRTKRPVVGTHEWNLMVQKNPDYAMYADEDLIDRAEEFKLANDVLQSKFEESQDCIREWELALQEAHEEIRNLLKSHHYLTNDLEMTRHKLTKSADTETNLRNELRMVKHDLERTNWQLSVAQQQQPLQYQTVQQQQPLQQPLLQVQPTLRSVQPMYTSISSPYPNVTATVSPAPAYNPSAAYTQPPIPVVPVSRPLYSQPIAPAANTTVASGGNAFGVVQYPGVVTKSSARTTSAPIITAQSVPVGAIVMGQNSNWYRSIAGPGTAAKWAPMLRQHEVNSLLTQYSIQQVSFRFTDASEVTLSALTIPGIL